MFIKYYRQGGLSVLSISCKFICGLIESLDNKSVLLILIEYYVGVIIMGYLSLEEVLLAYY